MMEREYYEEVKKRLAEVEEEVGKGFQHFPMACWEVVNMVYDQDGMDIDLFSSISRTKIQPADILYTNMGFHVGVVTTSGRHVLEVQPDLGLVCSPLAGSTGDFYRYKGFVAH